MGFGADGTRTRHFQIANLTLYQMSYGPMFSLIILPDGRFVYFSATIFFLLFGVCWQL